MAPESKDESSKHVINRPEWGEAALHGAGLLLTLLQDAAALSPLPELQKAAALALVIVQTIQAVKENKEAYKRLADDSGGLIIVIWESYKEAKSPEEWISAEMRKILEELTHTLEEIRLFVEEKLSRHKAIRVIFSKADVGKINEYRENLNVAMQKFELRCHINIDRKLRKLGEQIQHRNNEDEVKRIQENTARIARDREVAEKIQEEELKAAEKNPAPERLTLGETDHQLEDERRYFDELKRLEEIGKDREKELDHLRAVASANRLKKAQEEAEMAARRRKGNAAEENSRRSTTIQAQPHKKKVRRPKVEEEEEEWEGNVMREEEEEVWRPTRKNASNPATKRPVPVTSNDSTESLRSSKRRASRKPSNTSLRVEETDSGESTGVEEEEYMPPPPRKNPKVRPEKRNDKTLVVEKIPEDKLSLEQVNAWFKRFGTVTNVAIDAVNAKALVSFSNHEEAHVAWKSEDAVFNNRFVKVFWHRPMEGHGQVGTRMLAASAPLVANMASAQTPPVPQPSASAAEENSRRSTTIQAQPHKKKVRRPKVEEEEEEWEGNVMREEEEEVWRPTRKNASNPATKRPVPVTSNDSTESLRSSKRRASRKPSNTSLRVEETDSGESTGVEEEEYMPPPPRKNPKVRPEKRNDKTLVVEKIPEDKLSLEQVNAWFKRFGTVTNVAIDAVNAKALVSFSNHEEAHVAWKSEDAVFNNRFVKVFWHRPMEGHGQVGTRMLAASAPLVANMASAQTPPVPQPSASAAEENSRRSTTIQAQPHRKKVRRPKVEEEEEEWEGNVMREEEEEVWRPTRKNASNPATKRPVPVTSNDSTESLRSSKRRASRKPSNTSLRVEETDSGESTGVEEEEYMPPPPRKNPKVNRKPPTSSPSLPPDVNINDLMAHFQALGRGSPQGSRHSSRPESPMSFPYGPPPMEPYYGYGYGVGAPGSVYNSGSGNISNTIISNVGNDNSRVETYYEAPRKRYRRRDWDDN